MRVLRNKIFSNSKKITIHIKQMSDIVPIGIFGSGFGGLN